MTRQQLEEKIKHTQDPVERERLLQYLHYLEVEQPIGPAVADQPRSRKQGRKRKRK